MKSKEHEELEAYIRQEIAQQMSQVGKMLEEAGIHFKPPTRADKAKKVAAVIGVAAVGGVAGGLVVYSLERRRERRLADTSMEEVTKTTTRRNERERAAQLAN